jgi:dihydropteroate synthase
LDYQQFQLWLEDTNRRPLVMGVLNITPDSFSDGGRFADVDTAVQHAHALVSDGADLIDIGGESTRPGSQRIDAAQQLRRVLPVIRQLSGKVSALLSVDTTLATVAEQAVEAGAQLINDISAGCEDEQMLPTAARLGVPIVLMHMQGQPASMQLNPTYSDVVEEVAAFLSHRLEAANRAGIAKSNVLLDPGIGFGKKIEHNLTLLRQLARLRQIGKPLLVGTSRKSFVGRITGESEPSQRLFGTAASVAWCIANGADIVRVHDVGPMSKVVRMVWAIREGVAALDAGQSSRP